MMTQSHLRHRPVPFRASILLLTLVIPGMALAAPGLLLTLEAEGRTQLQQVSNVALRVPAGTPPGALVPPGRFTATWSGTLRLELRGDYQFLAEHEGAFTLELNGKPVLDGTHSDWTDPVRLRKGTNSLRAVLRGDGAHSAGVRLSWKGRGVAPGPIPPAILEHEAVADTLAPALALERGRDLFLTRHCLRCHPPATGPALPELGMEGPSFHGIGSRRTRASMEARILNPRARHPSSAMPRVLRGPTAETDAQAIAAWLATLREEAATPPSTGNPEAGKALFGTLRCGACHGTPGVPDGNRTAPVLDGVGATFKAGALAAFLRKPEARHAWTRMPNFHLTADEAGDLAAHLGLPSEPPQASDPGPDPALVERGRSLVVSRGCLDCHAAPLPYSRREFPLMAWTDRSSHRGCLAEAPPDDVPLHDLTPAERSDLRAFVAAGPASTLRHVPTDFARRWQSRLACGGCHDAGEGIPGLAGIGAKLRTDWMTALLEGKVPYKPRPWLTARMPAFPAFAPGWADGTALQHGYDPLPGPEPPPDPEAAAVGRRLVSASGGFACVTCHAVGAFQANAVFEAPGINLSHSFERLRSDHFQRWIRNPQAIDPGTKMPVYFDEDGNSPLAEYYGGDGTRTIRALWEYLRMGASMPAPN